MPLTTDNAYSLNRREFLVIGAATVSPWTSDAQHPVLSLDPLRSEYPSSAIEDTHLDIAKARDLLAELLQMPEWLNRHLDLQAYRTASPDAVRHLAQVSLPMWTVNFASIDVQTLATVLAADTANLRFGPQSDLQAWMDLDIDVLQATMAFAIEFDMPQLITMTGAERIRSCSCEALRFGDFDAMHPESVSELAKFEGSLIFDVSKVENPSIARALTLHQGEGVYIYSESRPSQEVMRAFLQTKRKSFSLEQQMDSSGWVLAWEPTEAFVQRQHRRFVGNLRDIAV